MPQKKPSKSVLVAYKETEFGIVPDGRYGGSVNLITQNPLPDAILEITEPGFPPRRVQLQGKQFETALKRQQKGLPPTRKTMATLKKIVKEVL